MDQQIREAVRQAAARSDVRDAIQAVYADLQAAIDARRPRCDASGRCCRFDEYGHRLYVTTMELAVFAAAWASVADPTPATAGTAPASRLRVLSDGGACRFQVDGLCSVHSIRPFGCRVFFCDETAADWQAEQYEQFHGRLKALHDHLGVPYYYVEWRAGLAAVGLSQTQVQL